MADFVEKSARYKDDRSMRQMELIFLKGLMDKKKQHEKDCRKEFQFLKNLRRKSTLNFSFGS